MTEKVSYCFWIPVRFVRGMTGLFSCNKLLGKQKRSSESTHTLPGYIKLHFTRLWLVEDSDWHFIGHLDWLTTVISRGKDTLYYQWTFWTFCYDKLCLTVRQRWKGNFLFCPFFFALISFGKFCLFLVLLNRSSVSPRLLFPLASNRMTSMPCARVFNRTTSHLLPPIGIDFLF